MVEIDIDRTNGELLLSHDMMNFVLLITHIQNSVLDASFIPACILIWSKRPGVRVCKTTRWAFSRI